MTTEMRSFRSSMVIAALESKLEQSGASAIDANRIALHLVKSELAGYASHGLFRVPSILATLQSSGATARPEASLEETAPSCWVFDGHGCIGIAAVAGAVEAIIDTVNAGVAVVGVRGYRGTTGRLGAYVDDLAASGCAAIAICNSDYAVAPWGGRKAIIGTNPIAFGIDGTRSRLIADVATAAMSYGAIKEVQRQNSLLPPGVVLDEHGRASVDPADADEGAQLPMAGHKGYALGLAVELFAGPLIGAKGGRAAVPGSDGTLLVAIRSDAFAGHEPVAEAVEAVLDEVRQAPLADGFDTIRIPGDSASTARMRLLEDFELPITDELAQDLNLA